MRSSRSNQAMRNYWLMCGALALLVLGLSLAPLRFMRRARAAQPTPSPVVTQPVEKQEAVPPAPAPTAKASEGVPAPMLIDFGGDEAEAEAESEETVQGNEPPPLSARDAEAAKKGLDWAMRGLLPEINGCYKQALTRDPKLRGDLSIEMTLAPSSDSKWATVEDAVIADNALQSPLLEQCVLIAVSKLRMEKPAGRLYITYPLHLQPGEDTKPKNNGPADGEPEHDVGEGMMDDGDDD